MDTAGASGTLWTGSVLPCSNGTEWSQLSTLQMQTFQWQKRLCYGETSQGEFPSSLDSSIVLHVLSACNLDPEDLAHLEATSSFFKNPANFPPDTSLSLAELAALDMCQTRAVFKPMNVVEKEALKQRCGGSWKLVLRFLKSGEVCYRRERCQAAAGPGHSVVVTKTGAVFTFGMNSIGQLGHDSQQEQWRPRLLRSLQGVRVIQATVGVGRTMLVTDMGQVYAFGKDTFSEPVHGGSVSKHVSTPRLVEALEGIFVVQTAIGNYFTAVLSREGSVYTFAWGSDAKLGHGTDTQDRKPQLLKGALENTPVVQIAAGYCYLLALAYQPGGMSVYSVGCGLGGKLGHGTRSDECYPRKIEYFQQMNLKPIAVAAGAWHSAAVSQDGSVYTWGWGRYGCLGHGSEESEVLPKVVTALEGVKAVHVATGDYATFVVADNGDVYSFGCGEASLGHVKAWHNENLMSPELVMPFKERKERIVQVSRTNTETCNAHTLALTESGRLYAFGAGDKGQLGIELPDNVHQRVMPELVKIDLS